MKSAFSYWWRIFIILTSRKLRCARRTGVLANRLKRRTLPISLAFWAKSCFSYPRLRHHRVSGQDMSRAPVVKDRTAVTGAAADGPITFGVAA